MARLHGLRYPDPRLHTVARPVAQVDARIQTLVDDMLETMYAAPGVGLAACQVGVPVRIVVIDPNPRERNQPIVLINPKFVKKENKITEEEGCLSLPGLSRKVKRYSKVRVEAVNEKGLPIVVEGSELLARVLQHEIDHLEGIVFIDYLPWWQKLKVRKEINERRKQGTW